MPCAWHFDGAVVLVLVLAYMYTVGVPGGGSQLVGVSREGGCRGGRGVGEGVSEAKRFKRGSLCQKIS